MEDETNPKEKEDRIKHETKKKDEDNDQSHWHNGQPGGFAGAEPGAAGDCRVGTVPGLYSRFVPLDNLEVGDEILFINFRGTYAYFKLNEGEAYTGSHTPEEMGWVAEDGRFIFGEDYVDFYYGDGYEICTYTVQGQEGNDYLIGCDEYSYVFNESYIEDFSHWNMESGHVYYAARNDQTVYIVDSDLFVLP